MFWGCRVVGVQGCSVVGFEGLRVLGLTWCVFFNVLLRLLNYQRLSDEDAH